MKSEDLTKLKFTAIGMLVGAVFALWGCVHSGYLLTQDGSARKVHAAVLDARAEICAGQFAKDPRYQQNAKEFGNLDFLKRDGYIEKGGWDRMPGEDKVREGVNRVCGDKIAAALGK